MKIPDMFYSLASGTVDDSNFYVYIDSEFENYLNISNKELLGQRKVLSIAVPIDSSEELSNQGQESSKVEKKVPTIIKKLKEHTEGSIGDSFFQEQRKRCLLDYEKVFNLLFRKHSKTLIDYETEFPLVHKWTEVDKPTKKDYLIEDLDKYATVLLRYHHPNGEFRERYIYSSEIPESFSNFINKKTSPKDLLANFYDQLPKVEPLNKFSKAEIQDYQELYESIKDLGTIVSINDKFIVKRKYNDQQFYKDVLKVNPAYNDYIGFMSNLLKFQESVVKIILFDGSDKKLYMKIFYEDPSMNIQEKTEPFESFFNINYNELPESSLDHYRKYLVTVAREFNGTKDIGTAYSNVYPVLQFFEEYINKKLKLEKEQIQKHIPKNLGFITKSFDDTGYRLETILTTDSLYFSHKLMKKISHDIPESIIKMNSTIMLIERFVKGIYLDSLSVSDDVKNTVHNVILNVIKTHYEETITSLRKETLGRSFLSLVTNINLKLSLNMIELKKN